MSNRRKRSRLVMAWVTSAAIVGVVVVGLALAILGDGSGVDTSPMPAAMPGEVSGHDRAPVSPSSARPQTQRDADERGLLLMLFLFLLGEEERREVDRRR
jgi:hypothetical protein